MDNQYKLIFQKHFDKLRRYAENTKIFDYLFAMQQLGSVYAEFFGMTYAQAMEELYANQIQEQKENFLSA